MAVVLLPGSEGRKERVIGFDLFKPIDAEGQPPEGHPVILLVPGFTLTRRRWADDFCQRLVDRGYVVVRMDNRDSGDSTRYDALGVPDVKGLLGRAILGLKVKAPYDLDALGDDCIGLMTALGFPRFHVAGASMGGMIVQLLALRSPTPVLSAAILMSSPGGRRYSIAKPYALRALLRPAPNDPAGQIEHFVATLRVLAGTERPFEETRIRAFAEDQVQSRPSRKGIARQFAAILASSAGRLARLSQIRVPTVIIHGSADPLLPLRGARALARKIPGARLVVIPGMGHDLPEAVYDEVVQAIDENARAVS